MIKRLLPCILLLLFLTIGTASCHSQTTLTLMVYLCGSDLETQAGAASADLQEMITHYPEDGSLRVIVMPAGSKVWQNGISANETAIYELTSAGLEKRSTLPLQSMGNPDALTSLLNYGYTYAPAQQYALLMWDHGAGPNVGLCFDELFQTDNSMDGLTLQELSYALKNSFAAHHKLSWIGFDACLMASVETACAVAPFADYMIASQETEPASGWDYRFLPHAASDSSGVETAHRVIDAYFQSLSDSISSRTLSCVALKDIPAISAMLDQLFNHLHVSLDKSSYPIFADCRINTKSLGNTSSYEYDLVDLVDLLEGYHAKGLADCSSILTLLDQAIVASRSNTEFIHGLSISYPHYGLQEQIPFPASEGYAAFIADMSAIRLGKPLTDWNVTYHPETELRDDVTYVTMTLTPEQAAMLDSATLFVLKQMSSNDYQLVYRSNDVSLTEDYRLSAVYEEQALFLVDAQGNAFSSAIPYTLQGNALVLNCMLTKDADKVAEEDWFVFVRCLFQQDEHGRYHLTEVQESTSDPTRQGKSTVRLEDYDTLSVFEGSHVPVYGQDGKLLPPLYWEKGDISYGWWFDLADFPDWSVAFLSHQDNRSRYALLQMTDTQNQVVCSELLLIPNPNIVDLPVIPQTLVNNDACCIRFTGAKEVLGDHPALRLQFTCENRDTQNIHVAVNQVQLDHVILSDYQVTSPGIDPGETKTFEIEVSREELESLAIQSAEQLRIVLTISHNYTDAFLTQTVVCSFSADLSSIAPVPMLPDILAHAAQNGLEFDLYDLACDSNQHLTGKLRIRNTTEAAVTLDAIGFYVNRLQLSGHLTDSIIAVTLPPGSLYHTGFQINLRYYPFAHNHPPSSRFLPESLGMTHLQTLEIEIGDARLNQSERVAFTLSQPLTLPIDKDRNRMDAWPVIYAKDGVTIHLASLTWSPDPASASPLHHINLLVDNTTDAKVTIQVPQFKPAASSTTFRVNGYPLDYVSPLSVDANIIVIDSLFYMSAAGYETAEQIDMPLCITDAHGRDDRILVRVDIQDDVHTEEDYCIFDGAQMLVTSTPLP